MYKYVQVTHLRIYVYQSIYVYMNIHIFIHIHVHINIYIYIYIYICICIYIYMHLCVCVCVYIHMNLYLSLYLFFMHSLLKPHQYTLTSCSTPLPPLQPHTGQVMNKSAAHERGAGSARESPRDMTRTLGNITPSCR